MTTNAPYQRFGVATELTFGSNEIDLVRALREPIQQNASQAGQQLVAKNLANQPTIKVRPGWLLQIIVYKDLVLLPWTGWQRYCRTRIAKFPDRNPVKLNIAVMPKELAYRLIPLTEAARRVGLGMTMIYKMIAEDRFPPPYEITPPLRAGMTSR